MCIHLAQGKSNLSNCSISKFFLICNVLVKSYVTKPPPEKNPPPAAFTVELTNYYSFFYIFDKVLGFMLLIDLALLRVCELGAVVLVVE